jgi:RNA polymerase sigma factor (sigma-70 family)
VSDPATLAPVPDITLPMDDDPHARRFALLFDMHRRTVLGYALRRVDDPADAADAVAETFLIAWRRLGDVPLDPQARAWLLGVARRVLANQRRGAQRRVGLAERLGRELPALVAAFEPPSEADLTVRRALARLSEEDREVLLLTVWDGLAPTEIATVIGVRAVTVRSRLHRARRRLRAELDALGVATRPRPPAALDLAQEPTP